MPNNPPQQPTRSVQQLGQRPARPEPMKPGARPNPGAARGMAPAQLGSDALQTVVTRNKFYREGYQSLMKIAIAQGIVVLVLACLVVYKLFIEPPPVRYFATTNDGKIMDLTPLTEPAMNDAAVLSWTSQAAADVMTFSFLDYQRRLQDSGRYFTPVGWEGFMTAIQESRFLEGVKANQQIITTVPSQAPVIIERNQANGRFYWRIQLPIVITFTSGEKKQSRRQLLNLTIVRVSPLEHPAGLGIEQWVASEMGGG
jgi:intracellular multiplication protein IcmL